jgi:hypothetical protein
MTRDQAIEVVDQARNNALEPVDMLNLTWVRVIISKISDEEWKKALAEAYPILSA